jgi:hypothetical protein
VLLVPRRLGRAAAARPAARRVRAAALRAAAHPGWAELHGRLARVPLRQGPQRPLADGRQGGATACVTRTER